MAIDPVERRRAVIARKLQAARQKYLLTWRRIILAWQAPDEQDSLWLTYSANYLLRTAGVRWAIDPFSLLTRIGGGVQPDFSSDLARLQLVVLTHTHSDHLDLDLIAAISHLPMIWVVPEFMLDQVVAAADLPRERVIVPQTGQPIHFLGLTITPFEALHIHELGGVPEIGFLAEFSGKRWLFPGDIRVYAAERLPYFGNLDGVFAHIWLGKARALENPPRLLSEFSRFYASMNPRRIVITHLEEFGRRAEDFWGLHHYRKVAAAIQQTAPSIEVTRARMGERVNL